MKGVRDSSSVLTARCRGIHSAGAPFRALPIHSHRAARAITPNRQAVIHLRFRSSATLYCSAASMMTMAPTARKILAI